MQRAATPEKKMQKQKALVVSDLYTELAQARDLIAQQRKLVDKKKLLENIDNFLTGKIPITSLSLEKLILILQANVDKNDYLKRHKAITPIEFLPEVPPIYKALQLVIDFGVKIREQEMRKLDAIKEDEDISEAMLDYRIHLLTGGDPESDDFEFWQSLHHYNCYPIEDFQRNQAVFDRLDIDLILSEKHYSTLSLLDAISLHHTQRQVQPGFISVGEDHAVQYNPITGECRGLLTMERFKNKGSKRWDVEKENLAGNCGMYPIRLMSVGITNCHTVIVRDSQDKIFMLHVSPLCAQGMSFFETMPAKIAYIDLHPNYNDLELGLSPGPIEVVVVDNRGWFDKEEFVKSLPKNVKVEQLKVIQPDFDPERKIKIEMGYGWKYCVCYLPENNNLLIVPNNQNGQCLTIESIFPKRQAAKKLENHADKSGHRTCTLF